MSQATKTNLLARTQANRRAHSGGTYGKLISLRSDT